MALLCTASCVFLTPCSQAGDELLFLDSFEFPYCAGEPLPQFDDDRDGIADVCDACIGSNCRIMVGFVTGPDPLNSDFRDFEVLEQLDLDASSVTNNDVILKNVALDATEILERGVQGLVLADTVFGSNALDADDLQLIESLAVDHGIGLLVEGLQFAEGVDNTELYAYSGVDMSFGPFPFREGLALLSADAEPDSAATGHPILYQIDFLGGALPLFSSDEVQDFADNLELYLSPVGSATIVIRSAVTLPGPFQPPMLIAHEYGNLNGGITRAASTVGQLSRLTVSEEQIQLVANLLCWIQAWNPGGSVSFDCGLPARSDLGDD